jgi:hypothetical protein
MVIATKASGVYYGGSGGRWPRPSEVSHDIAVAELYLLWLVASPTLAATWVSEAELRRRGFGDKTRLPDAMIDRDGTETVIEIGGSYSAAKLKEFHDWCGSEGLPYEIW